MMSVECRIMVAVMYLQGRLSCFLEEQVACFSFPMHPRVFDWPHNFSDSNIFSLSTENVNWYAWSHVLIIHWQYKMNSNFNWLMAFFKFWLASSQNYIFKLLCISNSVLIGKNNPKNEFSSQSFFSKIFDFY